MSNLEGKYKELKKYLQKTVNLKDQVYLANLIKELEKELPQNSDNSSINKTVNEFEILFENSFTAIALTDSKGQIINCNKALIDLLGYKNKNEAKCEFNISKHISDKESKEIIRNCELDNKPFEKEIQLKTKNGKLVDVLLNSRSVTFPDKKLFVNNLIDISQNKKVQKHLTDNQQFLNSIFNTISSGVYIIDPETREILDINNYALETLQYKKEEIVGKRCYEALCTSSYENCLGKKVANCYTEVEQTLLDSKGNAVAVLKTVKEIQLNGKKYILETFTDITEIKENEEKLAEREEILQATLEATDDGILVLDENEVIINSNKRFFEMWQFDSMEMANMKPFDSVKKSISELYNPLDAYKNVFKVKGSNEILLDVLFFKDGRVFERYSAPIIKNNIREGRVWRFKDITPQANAEIKLKELNEELENIINERTIELRISEGRLKEAQEIAHLGHWVLDLKTNKIKGSDNLFQIVGYKSHNNEINLDDFLKNVHPEDLYELKKTYLKSLKSKKSFSFEHRIIKPDKSIIYIRQKCKTFYGSRGEPSYSLGISQDITEQKLAANSILEREHQLEMAMESTGLGLWDWNMLTNQINIDQKFIEVIGYKGIIKGSKIKLDFLVSKLYKEDYNRILASFLNYTQEGSETFEEEFRFKRADGNYIWINARAKVFEWYKGKPSRSIGTFLNITDKREADIELQKSEEKFRKLTELSPSPICIQSIDKLLFVNPAWVQALGYTEKEALKHSFVDLVHPKDQELATRYSKLRLFGSKAPRRYEIKMMTKSGEVKWFDISVTVTTYEEQTASLAVLNDITNIKRTEQALRESEEKFKALFFGNHSVMILIDVENEQIIEANQSACNFYQYTSQKIKSMRLDEISLHTRQETSKSLKKAIKGSKNLFNSKHKLADGQTRDVEVYSGKVKYGGKDVLYAIIHDITDRVIAEEKIKKSQEELKMLNAQKDKFFSIISHDLKGPIGNFMNFAELLKNHKELLTNESADAIVDHTYNLANNTYKLLENLLIWSKSQLEGIKINPQMVPLDFLINESINLVKDGAENKGVEILNEVEKNMLVFVDKDTIFTVLRNLIGNAVKFTDKGGKITCTASKPKKNGNNKEYIHISIKDTGVGIPNDKIDNLFTLGKEFTTFGTKDEKGTGLGLILCKELVKLNGGEIWAKSKINKGSTFTFSVPDKPKY